MEQEDVQPTDGTFNPKSPSTRDKTTKLKGFESHKKGKNRRPNTRFSLGTGVTKGIGVKGRKTGITIKTNVVKDADEMDNVDDFFDRSDEEEDEEDEDPEIPLTQKVPTPETPQKSSEADESLDVSASLDVSQEAPEPKESPKKPAKKKEAPKAPESPKRVTRSSKAETPVNAFKAAKEIPRTPPAVTAPSTPKGGKTPKKSSKAQEQESPPIKDIKARGRKEQKEDKQPESSPSPRKSPRRAEKPVESPVVAKAPKGKTPAKKNVPEKEDSEPEKEASEPEREDSEPEPMDMPEPEMNNSMEEEEVVVEPPSPQPPTPKAKKTKGKKTKATPSKPKEDKKKEKVQKPKKAKKPKRIVEDDDEEPDGLRRSKRMRIEPLQFWKNEKVVYGIGSDDETYHIVDVIKKPRTPIREPRNHKQDYGAIPKVNVSLTGKPKLEVIARREEDFVGKVGRSAVFFNSFDTEEFASGIIFVPPKHKFEDSAETTHMLFVQKGIVDVTVGDKEFTLDSGSHFWVPKGFKYVLKNTHTTMCKVAFGQILN